MKEEIKYEECKVCGGTGIDIEYTEECCRRNKDSCCSHFIRREKQIECYNCEATGKTLIEPK